MKHLKTPLTILTICLALTTPNSAAHPFIDLDPTEQGSHIEQRTSASTQIEKTLDERTATLHIEGLNLGDMVIGSRAVLTFIQYDSKLQKSYPNPSDIPRWIAWHDQAMTNAAKDKKALFIVKYTTYKNWNFDPFKIKIADHQITKQDFYSSLVSAEIGELPPNFDDNIAIAVPLKLLKPGKTITISYEDNQTTWTVPKR